MQILLLRTNFSLTVIYPVWI